MVCDASATWRPVGAVLAEYFGIENHEPFVDGGGGKDRLADAARFERQAYGAIGAILGRGGAEQLRVVARDRAHRQHVARVGVDDDAGAPPGVELLNSLRDGCVEVILYGCVHAQHDAASIGGGTARFDHRPNRPAPHVPQQHFPTVGGGKVPLQRQLQPAAGGTVGSAETHNRRGTFPHRILTTPLVRHDRRPQAKRTHRRRLGVADPALDPDEARSPPLEELCLHFQRIHPQRIAKGNADVRHLPPSQQRRVDEATGHLPAARQQHVTMAAASVNVAGPAR